MGGRLASLLAGAWCLAGFAPATIESGQFLLLKLDGHHVSWPSAGGDGDIVLRYSIVTSELAFANARNCARMTSPRALIETSRLSWPIFRAELEAAFQLWRNVARVSFVEAPPDERADILIGAQVEPAGWAFAQVFYDAAAAGTTKPITQALVCLNPKAAWKVGFDGNLKRYDLRYTLAHEIGYAIGLDHPDGAVARRKPHPTRS